jgi:hypothetical protein
MASYVTGLDPMYQGFNLANDAGARLVFDRALVRAERWKK